MNVVMGSGHLLGSSVPPCGLSGAAPSSTPASVATCSPWSTVRGYAAAARRVFGQRRRLRRRGIKQPSCGAITFVQRFGSALQLNVHFHVLVPDGAFDDDGVFVADEAPDDDDVREILIRAGRRVVALLHRFFDDNDDRRREIDRLLESLDAASATPQPSLFPRDGRRAPLSAFIEGFSLHAATRVLASDRRGLWRLCAYGARGAVASSRLTELPDGRFAYDMKRALPDGRRQLVMTGVELLEKLVPLIPPTYANLTRFHGVFAPTSRLRDKVVPRPPSTSDDAASPAAAPVSAQPTPSPSPPPSPPSPKSTSVRSTYRYDWAALLKRVFGVDVLQCSRCQGQMRLIACIEEPDVARKILEHLWLRAEALPTLRAQAPPVTLELPTMTASSTSAMRRTARATTTASLTSAARALSTQNSTTFMANSM